MLQCQRPRSIQLSCSKSSFLVNASRTLQLEELAVGECSAFNDWELVGVIMPPVGIPSLPEGWAALRRLRRLALRGHNILRTLPDWLARSVLCAIAQSLLQCKPMS